MAVNLDLNVKITAWNVQTLRGSVIEIKNLWPKGGRNLLRDLINYPALNGDGFTPAYMGVGSSGADNSDSATVGLGTEVFRKLITRRLPLDSAFTYQLFLDPSEANGSGVQPLREVAIFTLGPGLGGTCWGRAVHPLIQKDSSTAITYDWTMTLTAA